MAGFILHRAGRLLGRSCLIQGAALIIVIPLMAAGVFLPLFLFQQRILSTAALIAWVALFGAAFFGGLLFVITFTLRRRRRLLDELLAPYGFAAQAFALACHRYTGTYRGVPFTLTFSRGPRLEITLPLAAPVRFALVPAGESSPLLGRLLRQQPPVPAGGDWPDVLLFTDDEAATRALLARPETAAPLRRLLQPDPFFRLRQVLVDRDTARLVRYDSRAALAFSFACDPQHLRDWLDALAGLARLLPRP